MLYAFEEEAQTSRELCRCCERRELNRQRVAVRIVVIVGSSQSLRHRLCGSVSSRLLARGHWPVVVVP